MTYNQIADQQRELRLKLTLISAVSTVLQEQLTATQESVRAVRPAWTGPDYRKS